MSDGVDAHDEFEALVTHLTESRGFDFTSYKRASLARRFGRRMEAVGVEGFAEYRDYLEVHPEEFPQLFDSLLINVTSFFRDAPMWERMRDDVLPQMLARIPESAPVRVWSAGCASGEETYSIAILLAEALGEDAFRRRVKIYGTDLDEDALTRARLGVYATREAGTLPAEILSRYFEAAGASYTFRRDLRRSVIFGRHDLHADAPISKLDLVMCRNTLMYFNAEAQERILDRFHFALGDDGVLVLGKAETLLTHVDTFAPIDLRNRIFRKVAVEGGARTWRRLPRLDPRPAGAAPVSLGVRDAAWETGALAQLVVSDDGVVVMANQRARSLLLLREGDVGRPLGELEVAYRPVELAPLVERVQRERRSIELGDLVWVPPQQSRPMTLKVQIVPLVLGDESVAGVSVTLVDVTPERTLRDELQRSARELETAYEELQSTNEELETTNEELQSTIEELETTNEELQSTNEELETMNEELQSTNEELHSVNQALRARSSDLDAVNAYLESILASLRAAVVVVDRELLVRLWNDRAEDLWGLRDTEVVGSNLLALDSGLPVDALRGPLRGVLGGGDRTAALEVPATNRRGRPIVCAVSISPLRLDGTVAGAIVLMEDVAASPDGPPARA